MTRAFRAVCAEPWAIMEDWLHVIAALAMRDEEHPLVVKARQQTGYRAGRDDEDRPPTPSERFESSFYVGAAVRDLQGQGSGRAVISDNVAIIPILGPIFPRSNLMTALSGATSCTAVQKDLSAALKDDSVESILFAIDSPGGAVSGVNALADSIYAARKQKPTAAHITGTGASAAYWLASASERITLERTGIVGSIGVVVAVPAQITPDRDGTKWIEVVSSNAPNKRPDVLDPEGVSKIRETLDAIETQFVGDVAKGRNVSKDVVLSDFGQGGVYVGSEARKRQMADGVNSFESALVHMRRVGKASRAKQAG